MNGSDKAPDNSTASHDTVPPLSSDDSSLDPLPFQRAAKPAPLTDELNCEDERCWPDIEGYAIKRYLKGGGFGYVFLAKSSTLNGNVAIKILKPKYSSDTKTVERFQREIHAAHQTRHASVVQLLSSGICRSGTFANCHYLVMEYMVGGDLDEWMRKSSYRDSERLHSGVEKLVSVAAGLAAIHQAGVIHRDMKPKNILLDSAGHAKVADFGLAAFIERDSDDHLTETGHQLGTLLYMAPEQILNSRKATARSDVYSLGIILYQLLCDLRPWQSDDPRGNNAGDERSRILSNLKTVPPKPSSKSKLANRQLQQIAMRCIDPEPAFRYSSALEVKESLEAWLHGDPDPHSTSWGVKVWHNKVIRPIKQRPARTLIITVSVLLLLALAYGVGYRCAYVWPSVVNYANATNFNGVPIGIHQLSSGLVSSRHSHYRFTTSGWYGAVIKIELLDSFGHYHRGKDTQRPSWPPTDVNCFSQDKNVVCWTLAYDAQGQHLETIATDHADNLVWRLRFRDKHNAEFLSMPASSPLIGDLLVTELAEATNREGSMNEVPRSQMLVQPSTARPAKTSASQVIFDWTSDGICVGAHYFDAMNAPAQDNNGIYGWTGTLNANRQVVVSRFLEKDQRLPCQSKLGVEALIYDYDSHGNLEKRQHCDRNLQPVHDVSGVSLLHYEYDEVGNGTSLRMFNAAGVPVAVDGSHGWDTVYDSRGLVVSETYVGIDNRPAANQIGVAQRVLSHDEYGRTQSERYFDANGLAMNHPNGIHGLRLEYDEKGNSIKEFYFDTKERPVNDKNGVAVIARSYDAKGHIESERYFDANNKQVLNRDGYAGCLFVYDERGNPVKETCIGLDGQPCNCQAGYSTVVQTINERGLAESQRYFDSNGQPTLLTNGIHGWNAEYDQASNRIVESYVGRDNQLCHNERGYAFSRQAFSARGQITSIRFFDTKGRPCNFLPAAYHGFDMEHDDRGNVILVRWVDTNGKPTNFLGGFTSGVKLLHPGAATIRRTFDKYGRQTSERKFDEEDRPITLWDGSNGWEKEFDDAGNEVVAIKLNSAGSPMEQEDGFAFHRRTYDSRNRVIKDQFFDTNRQPAVNQLGEYGLEYQLDDAGRVEIEFVLGANGQRSRNVWGFEARTVELNSQGRRIQESFLDSSLRPVQAINGAYAVKIEYSELLSTEQRTFLDAHSQPLVPSGLVVLSVTDRGTAQSSGVQVGDILLTYDGHRLKTPALLRARVSHAASTGDKDLVPIQLQRNGSSEVIEVKPGLLGVETATYYGKP